MVDFDEFGLRRSIQLKVLDLNDNGLVEIGTWTSTNRLGITSFGVQQMTAIRKHLQVVTREVRSLDFFSHLLFYLSKEKPYVVRKTHPNGSIYFEGYCS